MSDEPFTELAASLGREEAVTMDIGISVTSAHPSDVDARTAANWVVERAAAVAAAGFASF